MSHTNRVSDSSRNTQVMMAEGHAEATTTTTTVSSGTVAVNIGYPKSWQGVLKIIKIVSKTVKLPMSIVLLVL